MIGKFNDITQNFNNLEIVFKEKLIKNFITFIAGLV
jgi:hypothetical protein